MGRREEDCEGVGGRATGTWWSRAVDGLFYYFSSVIVSIPEVIILLIFGLVGLASWSLKTQAVVYVDTSVEAFYSRQNPIADRFNAQYMNFWALESHCHDSNVNAQFRKEVISNLTAMQGSDSVSGPVVSKSNGVSGDSDGRQELHVIASAHDNVFERRHVEEMCRLANATRQSMHAHKLCARQPPPNWNQRLCPEDSPCWLQFPCLPERSLLGLYETILSLREPLLVSALDQFAALDVTDKEIDIIKKMCSASGGSSGLLCAVPRVGAICNAQACQQSHTCLIGDMDPCLLFNTVQPTAQDIRDLGSLPRQRIDAQGCNNINMTALDATLRAAAVLIRWSENAGALPVASLLGYLVDRTFGHGPMPLRSGLTRMVFKLRDSHVHQNVTSGALFGRELKAYTFVDSWQSSILPQYQGGEGTSYTYRQWDYFTWYTSRQVMRDVTWATGAVVLLLIYMTIQTRTFFTTVGVVAGILGSIPLSLWVHVFVLGVDWIGVLTFLGIFIILGIGADDVFVIFEHWKFAGELQHSEAHSPREALICRMACTLQHSISAVTATSFTTIAAFGANFISVIAPVRLFGSFMVVLVFINYLLVIVLLPSLLILHWKLTDRPSTSKSVASCSGDSNKMLPPRRGPRLPACFAKLAANWRRARGYSLADAESPSSCRATSSHGLALASPVLGRLPESPPGAAHLMFTGHELTLRESDSNSSGMIPAEARDDDFSLLGNKSAPASLTMSHHSGFRLKHGCAEGLMPRQSVSESGAAPSMRASAGTSIDGASLSSRHSNASVASDTDQLVGSPMLALRAQQATHALGADSAMSGLEEPQSVRPDASSSFVAIDLSGVAPGPRPALEAELSRCAKPPRPPRSRQPSGVPPAVQQALALHQLPLRDAGSPSATADDFCPDSAPLLPTSREVSHHGILEPSTGLAGFSSSAHGVEAVGSAHEGVCLSNSLGLDRSCGPNPAGSRMSNHIGSVGLGMGVLRRVKGVVQRARATANRIASVIVRWARFGTAQEFFATTFTSGVIRWRWVIFATMFAIVSMMAYFASRIELPRSRPSAWKASHNINKYYKDELMFQYGKALDEISLWVVLGQVASDHGALNVPYEKGELVLAPGFNMTTEASQLFGLKLCRAMEQQAKVGRVVQGTVLCPHLVVDEYLRATGGQGLPTEPWRFEELMRIYSNLPSPIAGRNVQFATPDMMGQMVFDSHTGYLHPSVDPVTFGKATWKQKNQHSGWVLGDHAGRTRMIPHPYRNPRAGVPAVLLIDLRLTDTWTIPYLEMTKTHDYWQTWLQEQLATAPPELAPQHAFQTSDAWKLMDTSKTMYESANTSVVLSLLLSFFVLLIGTGNIVVAFIATSLITSTLIIFIGTMYVMGWTWGVMESVCVTVLVGLAVDYVVHSAHGYCYKLGTVTNEEAISFGLRTMAVSMFSAAFTTVGAAAFLLPCKMATYSVFGLFVIITLSTSYVTAIVVFPAMCAIAEPAIRRGNIAMCFGALIQGSRRLSNHWRGTRHDLQPHYSSDDIPLELPEICVRSKHGETETVLAVESPHVAGLPPIQLAELGPSACKSMRPAPGCSSQVAACSEDILLNTRHRRNASVDASADLWDKDVRVLELQSLLSPQHTRHGAGQ